MRNLSEAERKLHVEKIYEAVELYSNDEFPSEHRNHLGASIIGEPCSRKLWYTFRWVKLEQFKGRMRRLFQRGHHEEPRFIAMLRAIGFKVWDVDPDTGKQFRIYAVQGHFGGSGDSKAIIPGLPNVPLLLEFKTHNTKSFCHLVEKGLKVSKPQHYAQMCIYGKGYNFNYGLYCAVNKNDDDLFFDLVELDHNYAAQLENKARDIINAQIPPAKISENPSYFDCKYCNFQGVCHYNEKVEVNCRSCQFARPHENAQWYCHKWQNVIPNDYLIKGCPEHVSINRV